MRSARSGSWGVHRPARRIGGAAERRLGEALRTSEAIGSRFDAGRTHLALADRPLTLARPDCVGNA
jgi:hypothetical protein